MKKTPFLVGVLALVLCGCGPAEKQELTGRPAVLQLGMKISTASSETELSAAQAKVATLGQNEKVKEHLNKAIEAQRKLLNTAAEMQMNERIDGAKLVVSEIEAASNAVE